MTSRGFDGATTFSPGTAMAQFSTDCECWAPKRSPAPLAQRTTSGSVSWPSDMYLLLAISLAIRSQQTAKKSLNMISAMGRRPVIAAPIAAAEDGLLADRGVADPPRPPNCSSSPRRRLENAARRRDILAEEDHAGVAAHLLRGFPGLPRHGT